MRERYAHSRVMSIATYPSMMRGSDCSKRATRVEIDSDEPEKDLKLKICGPFERSGSVLAYHSERADEVIEERESVR